MDEFSIESETGHIGVEFERTLDLDAFLILLDGEELTEHLVKLNRASNTIGRANDCEIRIRRKECSRHHARIWWEQGQWFVEDLDSANGTKVCRKRVTTSILEFGDTISIAATPFRFLSADDPELQFHREVQQKAATDSLTGLYNRDFLKRKLKAAISSDNQPVLLIIDVDKFKQINDTVGHLAGDDVLLEVGRRIQNSIKDVGIAARISGDEFAVLVDDASHISPLEFASAICQQVRAEPILTDKLPVAVTISTGIALRQQCNANSVSELMAAADSALYAAKSKGRDQAFIAAGEPASD